MEGLINLYLLEIKNGYAYEDVYYALVRIYSLRRQIKETKYILLKMVEKFPEDIKAREHLA